MIDAMERTLAGSAHRSLSQDQLKQLDASIDRSMNGEGRSPAVRCTADGRGAA